MDEAAIIEGILRNAGFGDITVTEPQKAYRGSPEPKRRRVLLETDGVVTVAVSGHIKKLQDIMQIQDAIPHAAKILEIVRTQTDTAIALIEYIDGTLLWELESSRPSISVVHQHLQTFISDLGQVSLVHADLRPWNIYYQPDNQTFRYIDWGFAFFIGRRKYGNTFSHLAERGHRNRDEAEIDSVDVVKTINVLKNPDQTEVEWCHPPNYFPWRPVPWEQ